ncbi:MAG: hypothetical protein A2X94_04690 [Bdellovibrionales bacterium GWB1_55_8]|nr:MAG: hypothetical protein A2X94_04690 [Bdellovibrionales bacterium GWB1_55_8]
MSLDPLITRGSILVYRVFDVGEEIDLKRLEELFRGDQGKSRLRISRGTGQALVMRDPPVRLTLGETLFHLQDKLVRAETFATAWDYGVVSLVFQIPIVPGSKWSELVRQAPLLNGEQAGAEEMDSAARRRVQELVGFLSRAMTAPGEWAPFEDYVLYFLEKLEGMHDLADLMRGGLIPKLILGESQERLAQKSRSEIEDHILQYAETDLVAIDWNSAVVVEPAGNRDVPDVIEFALTHLLEFRYYDDLLDQRLASVYKSVDVQGPRFRRRNFAQVSREANARFIEISEFLERIDNSLKVVGDFYLAVIFRVAVKRFRIPDWQVSIRRKMNLLAQVSQMLLGEANARRGHLLEGIIILLIAFEIISAILKSSSGG